MSVHSEQTPPDFLDNLLDELVSVSTFQPDDISLMPDDDVSTTSRRDKVRACIMTMFPPDQEQKWLLPQTYFSDLVGLRNWCAKFEICPKTLKLHVHAYCEWDNTAAKRFQFLTDAITRAIGVSGNIQITKKLTIAARACAVNYVLKPDDLTDIEAYQWPHSKHKLAFDQTLWDKRPAPKEKANKEDRSEEMRAYIDTRPRHWTWDQIVHETLKSKQLLCCCSWGKGYHAGRASEIPRRNIAQVVIMYGAGGTGKTTLARDWDSRDSEDLQERYYRRNPDDGQFWGGGRTAYKGQRIVHLEEFCGQEQFARVKEICDIGKPGPSVNVKNGGAELNHECVVFTSNHHPAAFYSGVWKGDAKQFHPFWRRVTKVLFFPAHRPDGSLNIPDDTTPPFYIDQSEDWQLMLGDYESCTSHASVHWPLKEAHIFDTGNGVPQTSSNDFHSYCQTGRAVNRGA